MAGGDQNMDGGAEVGVVDAVVVGDHNLRQTASHRRRRSKATIPAE